MNLTHNPQRLGEAFHDTDRKCLVHLTYRVQGSWAQDSANQNSREMTVKSAHVESFISAEDQIPESLAGHTKSPVITG